MKSSARPSTIGSDGLVTSNEEEEFAVAVAVPQREHSSSQDMDTVRHSWTDIGSYMQGTFRRPQPFYKGM